MPTTTRRNIPKLTREKEITNGTDLPMKFAGLLQVRCTFIFLNFSDLFMSTTIKTDCL